MASCVSRFRWRTPIDRKRYAQSVSGSLERGSKEEVSQDHGIYSHFVFNVL